MFTETKKHVITQLNRFVCSEQIINFNEIVMAFKQTALRAKYENYNFHLIIYLLLQNVKREQFSS